MTDNGTKIEGMVFDKTISNGLGMYWISSSAYTNHRDRGMIAYDNGSILLSGGYANSRAWGARPVLYH